MPQQFFHPFTFCHIVEAIDRALDAHPKVNVLAAAIANMGFNQEVLPLAINLISPAAVRKVSQCDIVFGCMDRAEGRHILNRLATFYSLPYFDVGIRLDADGNGGIDSISGAVHYIQPGLSSLLSRGCYDRKRVEAEEIRRVDPKLYRRQVQEGYLRGVEEDRPAVVSVNTFFAAVAVNELLARLHPYRNLSNDRFAYLGEVFLKCNFMQKRKGSRAPSFSGMWVEEILSLFWKDRFYLDRPNS